jgi:hypothetical protein
MLLLRKFSDVKYYLTLFLLAVAFGACKKKAAPPFTTMTVKMGDSTWTENNVQTTISSDRVDIACSRSGKSDYVTLKIKGYQEGNHTYGNNNRGTSLNVLYSYGYALYDHVRIVGQMGEIVVTGHNGNTITGTFKMADDNANISGSFIVPRP